MGETAHVASTLHIVLATQGVHTHAFSADHAAGHGQVGNAHDHGRALGMLGNAQAVINSRIGASGIHACSSSHLGGGHTGHSFKGFR